MTNLRFQMLAEALRRKAKEVKPMENTLSENFGMNVFNKERMAEYLSANTYQSLTQTIDRGEPLGRELAEEVADGMRKWAIKMGATHYTHWFQPLTGTTAEKHDSFLAFDKEGSVIEEFSAKFLIQQEPDASSFPNGGIRNTFEARGYSAWDPTSPAFIMDTTLCIPTVFISYNGDALDFKSPLLKAERAIDKAATAVCQLFDPKVEQVVSFLGWEQEYFLVDESLWAARPDLAITGRTLVGNESAKNQQLEDHYFGAIPSRVLAFMKELEQECIKLGIPAKTRHNEVAPNQFELAPIFERMNLANDHNQVLMTIMKKIAHRHSFRLLLHEKPFKGINGSGKHCNWSLGTDLGYNLLSTDDSESRNMLFVTFLVNILLAVYKNNALLKASISSATNAHRLGGNEAPPAIISTFLGAELSTILNTIVNSDSDEAVGLGDKCQFTIDGINYIPELFKDNTDRNRTSPFAFTGNRFEFRAVGSSANCAGAMLILNTIVADQLTAFHKEVTMRVATGETVNHAALCVIREYIKESEPIRFDGNGYSEEWQQEANRRGLNCETSVPVILKEYVNPRVIELFSKMGVFSSKELEARYEINLEMYVKKLQIEARLLGDIALNHIVPTATRYQQVLLSKVLSMKSIYPEVRFNDLCSKDLSVIELIANHIAEIQTLVEELSHVRKEVNAIESMEEKAWAYHDKVLPFFEPIRYNVDRLERYVDDELWPLPKYRELLFVR